MAKKTGKSVSRATKENPDDFNSKEPVQNETDKQETDRQRNDSSGDSDKISMENKLSEMEKDHLYLCAEIENIKRQNFKKRSQLLKYGGERLARDLLETLDVFKSVLDSEVNQENYRAFVKGVEMTAMSLKTTLETHGIKELDCIGKVFDPNTQEALASEVTDKCPEGHVIRVFKAPYTYHDKLLRPGQVVVSSRLKT